MAFPAAPTESGSAKIHFLTTDGNSAAGWFGVTEGPTGTGANTVGFAAIATHVEGDAVAAPGGLNTTGTDVPVVLVAGDDGTNAVPLQLDASGDLKVVLTAGTAEVGKLAAGVAEVGNVKNSGTFVVQVDGAALTALQLIDNPVAVLGTATYTETSTSGMIAGAVRNDALATLAGTDNEIAPLQVNASGALYTVLSAGTAEIGKLAAGTAAIGKLAANSGVDIGDVDILTVTPGTGASNLGKAEDAVHGSGDVGVMSLAVRNDALAALGGADGDYAPLQVGEDGGLWTRPSAGPLGGCKMFTSVDLDQTEEDPTSGPTTIYGIYAWNATAAPLWLQMFNTNTVTVGTTAPTNNFLIPANADSDGAGVVIPIPVCGLAYSTALTVAITTGSGTDNGAPGAGDAGIVILYQD